ncbi:hypothetical protein NC652_039130 [Populus alba x Populus x berolinensis]|nr:hypothetical protein NC652_039130 [Populus alba x Populus x berolinensis]
MARLIRTATRTLFSSFSSSTSSLLQTRNAITSSFLFQSPRPYSADNKITKSPFEANILRIIDKEIDYQSEYAPPYQPEMRFHSFTVEDRSGEQWMIMRGKYDDIEDVKLEVTMFDGYVTVPKLGDDASGEDVRLHISFIVDVSKGDGGENLEFLCSAWPDRLEIQKVYLLRGEKMPGRPYMGPDFRKLNKELQKRLREYLEARGVNDELSFFLHDYMLNKDRIELIQWLGKITVIQYVAHGNEILGFLTNDSLRNQRDSLVFCITLFDLSHSYINISIVWLNNEFDSIPKWHTSYLCSFCILCSNPFLPMTLASLLLASSPSIFSRNRPTPTFEVPIRETQTRIRSNEFEFDIKLKTISNVEMVMMWVYMNSNPCLALNGIMCYDCAQVKGRGLEGRFLPVAQLLGEKRVRRKKDEYPFHDPLLHAPDFGIVSDFL